MNRLPPKKVLLWRFVTGAHLDGKPRTNASWLKVGTAPRYRCNWWNRKPRLYRCFWRLGGVAVLSGELLLGFGSVEFWICNAAGVYLASRYLARTVRAERTLVRRVNTELGERNTPDVERGLIDEIGVEAVPEYRGNVRDLVRKRRNRE